MYNVFISAYLNSLDINQNKIRHNKIKDIFNRIGLDYKEGIGVYKGTQEESILIPGVNSVEFLFDFAKKFNQESILFVDIKTNKANLMFSKEKIELIGELKTEFIKPDNIDYSLFNNVYYVVR